MPRGTLSRWWEQQVAQYSQQKASQIEQQKEGRIRDAIAVSPFQQRPFPTAANYESSLSIETTNDKTASFRHRSRRTSTKSTKKRRRTKPSILVTDLNYSPDLNPDTSNEGVAPESVTIEPVPSIGKKDESLEEPKNQEENVNVQTVLEESSQKEQVDVAHFVPVPQNIEQTSLDKFSFNEGVATLPSYNETSETTQEDDLGFEGELSEISETDSEDNSVSYRTADQKPQEQLTTRDVSILFELSSPDVDLRDYGNNLFVLGSSPELGEWQISDNSRMWDEEENRWTLFLNLESVSCETVILYRYAVQDDDGSIREEKMETPRKIAFRQLYDEVTDQPIKFKDEWEVPRKSEEELKEERDQIRAQQEEYRSQIVNRFLEIRRKCHQQSTRTSSDVHNGQIIDAGLVPDVEDAQVEGPSPTLAQIQVARIVKKRSKSNPFRTLACATPVDHFEQHNALLGHGSVPNRVVFSVPFPEKNVLTENMLFSFRKDLPNLPCLRDHFLREGRLDFELGKDLIAKVMKLLASEPNVLHLRAPCVVIGDLHGQFYDMMQMLDLLKKKSREPPHTTFVFLGDYVDRGCFSTEVLFYLYAMKIAYPKRVFLLRGNHESKVLSSFFNFKKECEYKYNQVLFDLFTESFNYMPLAAILKSKYYGNYLAVHGGLSPAVNTISDIESINRFREIDPNGPLCDLMWSDPAPEEDPEKLDFSDFCLTFETTFRTNSTRGCAHLFSYKAIESFLERNSLMGIIRGHEAQEQGYLEHYFGLSFNKVEVEKYLRAPLLLTIFSAPNYCDTHKNMGAVLLFEDEKKSSSAFFNMVIYSWTDHPYYLPDFMNAVSYSLPFVIENLGKLLLLLIKSTDDETDADDDEFHKMLFSGLALVEDLRRGNETKMTKQRVKERIEALPEYYQIGEQLKGELWRDKMTRKPQNRLSL
eukprot:TRINITY_DN15806_c0_g1_i1.p1 TRINITY_DN15806_c0_g1~~TRINITY_DN15806_c0_g1_i1.p1  ORF type:complete len:929 (-),score=190.34 TRINITY_DN15806_c0_g1_i1:40-2826(-)